MRKITADFQSDIEDAAAAGLLGNLPPSVAEKDIHITDVLAELAKIDVRHTAQQLNRKRSDPLPSTLSVRSRLIFAGGTCLSKAYGLIERMSEDIDIKILLDDIPDGYRLGKGHTDRKRLGDIQTEVCERLARIGFSLDEVEDPNNPLSRNNRRYFRLAVAYEPVFAESSGVLRPELKVELIHRHPLLQVNTQSMGYLLDRLVRRSSAQRFSMSCISVAETLAEKVLSFLRRCASKWDSRQRGEFDTALVRHLYDVWRIQSSMHYDAAASAAPSFRTLVMKEVEEYGNQHPEFAEHPFDTLRRALTRAQTDDDLRRNFAQRLLPLVFAAEKPTFDMCFSAFASVANQLLAVGAGHAQLSGKS